MAGLISWKLAAPLQSARSRQEKPQCCRASNNKDRSNYINIGSGRPEVGDAVEIIRVDKVPQSRSASKTSSSKPAPPVLPVVDTPPEQQKLVVEATKRGRGGKTVTIIKGLQLRLESMEVLCKKLKSNLGTGGSVKNGQLELQGDHTQKLVDELVQLRYNAKKCGR